MQLLVLKSRFLGGNEIQLINFLSSSLPNGSFLSLIKVTIIIQKKNVCQNNTYITAVEHVMVYNLLSLS